MASALLPFVYQRTHKPHTRPWTAWIVCGKRQLMNAYLNPLYAGRRFNSNNYDNAIARSHFWLILRLFWPCVIRMSHLTFKLPSFPFHSRDEASPKQSSFPCKLLCLTPRVTLLHYFIPAAQVPTAPTGDQTEAENTAWHQCSEISLPLARSSDAICLYFCFFYPGYPGSHVHTPSY